MPGIVETVFVRRRDAFTLIELLVVVAIIVALLAILLPSMGRAVFVSQVAVCASHFHQATISNVSYAADNFGAFPRHDITWTGIGRNAWDIHVETVRQWDVYGYTYGIWHCPVRSDEYPYADSAQAIDAFRWGGTENWGTFPMNYWVPRRDAGNWIVGTGIDGLAQPDAWPTRTSHPMIGKYPFLSDEMLSHPTTNSNPFDPGLADGGHPYGGRCESTNAGYVDGRVETHRADYDEVRRVQANYVNWF